VIQIGTDTANVVHLADEIWLTARHNGSVSFDVIRNAALAVNSGGRIIAVGPRSEILSSMRSDQIEIVDHEASVIVPGFIDAHLHCPQLDVIGSGGLPLLDWLNRFVFPAEAKFSDPTVSSLGARRLVRELKKNGITTAAVFSSVHAVATDALFREFESAGLRLITGKTSMDMGAPTELLESVESDLRHQNDLIENWHGKSERLYYAVTPRFALSCSKQMLRALGDLKAKWPSCFIQTHISENKTEVAEVQAVWKQHRDYLGVYEDHGLLDGKTLLGHGIHLTDTELKRIEKVGATVVHCPTSNTFLGSGLFNLRKAQDFGVRVCLASDVGAGTSLSPWKTMLECYKIQALQGEFCSASELLYRATLAGAEALGMERQSGSLEVGKFADFVVINQSRNLLLAERLVKTNSAEERFFATMTHGDDRITESVFVAGKQIYRQTDLVN
jgi:guanine deaminase